MKAKIWTVAADDRFGTRSFVFVTEKQAYEQWIEWQFPGEFDENEAKDREIAAAFIQKGDYQGLSEWKDEFFLGEPSDTYAVDEDEIDLSELVLLD
jgi:hypothetical protein